MRPIHLRAAAAALAALVALALVPSAAAVVRPAPRGQELKEADHKKLGDLLKKYINESGSAKAQGKVRQDLQAELERIGKKLAGKDGDPIQAALALTEDLEHSVALSFERKSLRGGKVEGRELEAQGAQMEYALWLPASYKPGDGPYPMVLIAPELKEGKPMSGAQLLQEFWTDAPTREATVLVAVTLPADIGTWTQLFVEDGSGKRQPGGLAYLMAVYADVQRQIAVDADRVFLAGRGPGVAAAMKLGSTFPHLFAGVIGQAGDAGEVAWQNFQNLPVFLQGGGAQATDFVDKVKGAGYGNATLKADATEAEILTWMNDHPRIANPVKVMLVPGSPIPNSAYWIEVPPTDAEEGTYVKGEVDRATNTLRIEGKGVREVVLYFNDLLVDMNKPLKLVLNGEERELLIPRNMDDFLGLFERGTNDAGRVYVARRGFDLPE